jgi:hypothetical protein
MMQIIEMTVAIDGHVWKFTRYSDGTPRGRVAMTKPATLDLEAPMSPDTLAGLCQCLEMMRRYVPTNEGANNNG